MKKLIVITAFLMFAFSGFSQSTVATQEQLEAFFKTKTLVVAQDNPLLDYNVKIKEAVKNTWTLTEYDFITYKEFDEKREDPKYSFLVVTEVMFSKDKTKAKYNFLSLLLGGKYRKLKDMPDICSVPLSYVNVEEEKYVYKLGIILQFIQSHVKLTRDNPKLKSSNIIRYYNKNLKTDRDKILYVIEDELSEQVNTLEKIKKYYPYQVKIVTREEAEKAIDSKEKNVVFFHKIGPEGTRMIARCWKLVIGVKDAKLYYFNYHVIDKKKKPDGFLAKDFKKLAKAKKAK